LPKALRILINICPLQKSIDYIEGNLENEIAFEEVAQEAYMSFLFFICSFKVSSPRMQSIFLKSGYM